MGTNAGVDHHLPPADIGVCHHHLNAPGQGLQLRREVLPDTSIHRLPGICGVDELPGDESARAVLHAGVCPLSAEERRPHGVPHRNVWHRGHHPHDRPLCPPHPPHAHIPPECCSPLPDIWVGCVAICAAGGIHHSDWVRTGTSGGSLHLQHHDGHVVHSRHFRETPGLHCVRQRGRGGR